MGMFGPKPGTAWLSSKIDPRFNVSISCNVGGFVMPPELEKEKVLLQEKYGFLPEDLSWEYMKD